MRCEDVRERLPGYLDRDLRAVGALELHLASCRGCRAELDAYGRLRAMLAEMGEGPEASPRLLHDLIAQLPLEQERVHSGTRARYALASLGGAAVGATALAIVWWRVARRPSQDVEDARAAAV